MFNNKYGKLIIECENEKEYLKVYQILKSDNYTNTESRNYNIYTEEFPHILLGHFSNKSRLTRCNNKFKANNSKYETYNSTNAKDFLESYNIKDKLIAARNIINS